MVMTGVDMLSWGVEVSADVALSWRVNWSVFGSWGDYTYSSNANVTTYADSDNSLIVNDAPSYISGYHQSGVPSSVVATQIAYSSRSNWRLSLALNYAGGRYIAISPLRRMTRVSDTASSPEAFAQMCEQEKLDTAFTVDASVMKSFVFTKGQRLICMLSARNLLNNKSIVYNGYEQMRILRQGSGINRTYTPFANKYTYAYPISIYLSVTYKF